MTPQNPFILIGLTGLAGAGKDTVADMLRTHCGAYPLAFADALRAEVANAFGVDIAMLFKRETKELPTRALRLEWCSDQAFVDRMIVHHAGDLALRKISLTEPRSPRQILQWWGTEYRRAQNPRYWTDKTHQHIQRAAQLYRPPLIVLTDVRFDNEAALVRTWQGRIWQIARPGLVSFGTGDTRAHASEVSGAQFAPDAVIENDSSFEHLCGKVLSAYAAQLFNIPGLKIEVPWRVYLGGQS